VHHVKTGARRPWLPFFADLPHQRLLGRTGKLYDGIIWISDGIVSQLQFCLLLLSWERLLAA
jgi:hypothetical protein